MKRHRLALQVAIATGIAFWLGLKYPDVNWPLAAVALGLMVFGIAVQYGTAKK